MVKAASKNWIILLGFGLTLGLALGLAIQSGFPGGLLSRGSGENEVVAQIGSAAPDFELERIDGGSLSLNELRGKPVLINFWATWCGPCVVEMPSIQKYYESYPGAFEVVAINADESRSEVVKFVEDIEVTFPVVLDPGLRIQALYRPRGLPTSYILDSQGVISSQHIGMLSEDQLEEYLAKVGVGP